MRYLKIVINQSQLGQAKSASGFDKQLNDSINETVSVVKKHLWFSSIYIQIILKLQSVKKKMIKFDIKELVVLCFIIGICASQDLDQFRTLQLQRHNQKRALHQNTSALKLNDTLNNAAQAWANYLAANNKFEHNTSHNYGQNIYFYGTSANISYSSSLFSATASWYGEIKDYNYSNPVFSLQTGHFTQVVWKSTTDVGFGVARTGNNWYVVANYNPPGNFVGQFTNNVLPLIGTGGGGNPVPVPVPEPQPTAATLTKFRSDQLKKHNQYRSKHNASNLILNSNLNSLAQKCAQNYRDGIACTGSYGKSYYNINSANQLFNYAVDAPTFASIAWYSKKSSYVPSKPIGSTFTAMVWKSTTAVGFGLATKIKDGIKNWYVVAYYNPAGNLSGKYSTNVKL